jgi:bifunctional DNA-binding transcriptional regulator/antitoxin component of YhaV-PrlF toxin-antitoxin module
MMSDKRYTVELEEDENGELILPLPDELLKEMSWKEGDQLNFTDNKDGTYSMTKVEQETKLVMVETVSMFRMRYVVEIPKNKPNDWALDTVTMEEAVEFSQKHIAEEIISHRVITKEEFLEMFDRDNSYLKVWDEQKKVSSFITKINSEGDIVD